MENFKILVVEDDITTSKLIKTFLSKEGYDVTVALDGEEALEKFYETSPHLILLDLVLPDISGEELCRSIRKISDVPIIMVTAKEGEESFLNGIEIGADDYVKKPFNSKELSAKVKALIRRVYDIHSVLTFNDGKLNIYISEHKVVVNNKEVYLTPIEFDILKILASSPNKVFSRESLSNLSKGYNYDSFERAVDVHIRHIRSKIEEDSSNPKYIITVYKKGYKFQA